MNTVEAPKEPYKFQRYPLVLHKDGHSKLVHSEEEESAAVRDGYSTDRPKIEPPAESEDVSLEERVAALEADMAELKSAKRPGRPKKEE